MIRLPAALASLMNLQLRAIEATNLKPQVARLKKKLGQDFSRLVSNGAS